MAINQIKVANEAKQDITISKTDQILGRLADQTIVANTVKSVQRGVVEFTDQTSAVGEYYHIIVSINNVDVSKCDVSLSPAGSLNSNVSACLNSMTSSSLTVHVGKGRTGKLSWQVIEYY